MLLGILVPACGTTDPTGELTTLVVRTPAVLLSVDSSVTPTDWDYPRKTVAWSWDGDDLTRTAVTRGRPSAR